MRDFNFYLKKTGEVGIIELTNYPIVSIQGLPGAKPNEIVIFETGELGEIFSVNHDNADALVFSTSSIKVGSKVVRTDESISVPVGEELLGHVIDPLGNPLSQEKIFNSPKEKRSIETVPPGINERENIKRPFTTGISIIDNMVPLGKGQKEAIVGDRKTGKTSFLFTMVKSQVKQGSKVIYAAIAKKKSDIKKLEILFEEEKLLDDIVIVASSSFDSPSLIYITPYSAMSMAEYFKDKGEDVVVILDDLSAHAKVYREISLVAKHFPGRDSYPGDIFFAHSRLVERGGNFKQGDKEVSITCFPVVETVEGDLTNYVTTNVMSMTDGHIFLDSNAFYRGRRPAVDISLSVTRVGRQTQNPLARDINREIMRFLSSFEKMQNLAHFGAELTDSVKHILKVGEDIYKFFNQPPEVLVPPAVQMVMIGMIWFEGFANQEENFIFLARDRLTEAYEKDENVKKLFYIISDVDNFGKLLLKVKKYRSEILSICKASVV